jgi:hypothetical protein
MTGGGGYCSGGTGVAVGLGGSVGGVYYQLYRGTSPVGTPVAGGSSFTFGLQTVAGTYTAIATNSYGCTSTMSGTAVVTVYALPAVYSVTGGGSYCSGSTGVHIGVSGSATGNSYKLYLGGTPVSSAIPGTGAPLDFGLYTTAGTYTVIATNSVSGCTSNMTGSATITVNPNPTISGSYYTVAPAGTRTLTGSPAGGMWSSSAPSIATIGATSGIVNGLSLGTTTITYTLSTGCFAVHSMAVTPTGLRSTPSANTTVAASSLEGAEIVIAPNPSNGSFVIRGNLNSQSSKQDDINLSMKITNITGKIIYNHTMTTVNGELNEQFNLRDLLPGGIYFIILSTDGENKVYRLVVE